MLATAPAILWHIRACASTGFLVRACGYTTAHTNIGMKDYLIGKSTNSASYIIAILSLHLALITMLAHYTC